MSIILKQFLAVVIHVKESYVIVLRMKSRVNAIPVISETIERQNAINALKLLTIVNSITLIVLLIQNYIDFLLYTKIIIHNLYKLKSFGE